jgi:hypothetical protein
MLEAEVDDARNRHEQTYADHREPTRPPAGLTVPALAQDVLHRRTPETTLTHRPPRYVAPPRSAGWQSGLDFAYPHGSIFDAVSRAGLTWRIYNDDTDAYSDDPIEPNYGDITSSYRGGSSQHPMDDSPES